LTTITPVNRERGQKQLHFLNRGHFWLPLAAQIGYGPYIAANFDHAMRYRCQKRRSVWRREAKNGNARVGHAEAF